MKGLIYYTASLTTKLRKYFRKGILNKVFRRVEEILSPRVDSVEELAMEAFDELYYFLLPISEEKDRFRDEINLRITEDILDR
ncbi:hypothetical protein MYX76_11640, partial [Desulfobacterota bacterium AH_259_B03_O07]|nr:hypothetical protein [Desulfobacterota bacterium AH_259_B03_O07]